MLNYEECRAIAEKKAEYCGQKIAKAYKIHDDYVFETAEEYVGAFPVAVYASTGETSSLWNYLGKTKTTMDDMQEIEL